MTRQIAVIGAGIVGVSTALWLQREGLDVTLIDRDAPGSGTSHGNGGVLAACAMVPVTVPGILGKAPGMLLDKEAPLFLRLGYLPKLAPWLARYLAHANDKDTQRISQALTDIVGDSIAQHQSLCAELGLQEWVRQSDYCFAYANRTAFDQESYVWALRAEAGFAPEFIEGADVQDYEPALAPEITFVARMGAHGYIADPGGYVRALAAAFAERGGKVLEGDVHDIVVTGERVEAVLSSAGRLPCQGVVLSTGVWSTPLMKKLGLKIPLETERGYHIVFEAASGGPSRPFMMATGKFVATPMTQGLRCAGILEFGGLDKGPSKAPLALIRRQARRAFPKLRATSEIEWLGHRPAPADSLPLIGQIGETGIYTAFGHHHIGLTGGPKTGRLIAGLISGRPVKTDLRPFHPQRFS
ncbi:MAG: FAD-binding oxidoreductase [Pseudomonadota bacterium]